MVLSLLLALLGQELKQKDMEPKQGEAAVIVAGIAEAWKYAMPVYALYLITLVGKESRP
uniref:Uncharacterized protein n=1 Tax=viral metagenome TaxID=1070528 RepID=A0A6H1Z9M6_9ZZZZ